MIFLQTMRIKQTLQTPQRLGPRVTCDSLQLSRSSWLRLLFLLLLLIPSSICSSSTMKDQSANSVANRNEPIPVISPPNSSGNDDAKSKQHKHKRSGSRSLQDRLFTKYANLVSPTGNGASLNSYIKGFCSRCSPLNRMATTHLPPAATSPRLSTPDGRPLACP